MSKRVRITALILVAIMLCGALAGLMGIVAQAATDTPVPDENSVKLTSTSSGSEVRNGGLSYGSNLNVYFEYTQVVPGLDVSGTKSLTGLDKNKFTLTKAFGSSSNPTLDLIVTKLSGEDNYLFQVRIKNTKYTGSSSTNVIEMSFNDIDIDGFTYDYEVSVPIPEKYTESSGINVGGNEDDEYNPYKSDIVVENIYFTDSSGQRIDKVDKDSPSFNLNIVFADYGLREVSDSEFKDKSLEVFLTETGGFYTGSGTRGTLKFLNSSSTDAPRFQATFRNVTFEGGSNAVTFRAQYDIEGWDVSGTGSAVANNAKEDDDEDKLSPLTPHVIINQYSYGTDDIYAGSNFTLNMSIINTSPDIPLENIVMIIQPYIPENNTSSTTGGLTITSASNTLYIPYLGVGQSYAHSIDLRAEPSAAVGSHKVEVDFSFQYVDDVNKSRETSTDKESIAIPVSQVDRFSVDPLTEIPDIMWEGDTEYLTLTFVNKGKSTTYNISGVLTSNMSEMPQSVHFGNLEAGAADSIDFEVKATEPGQMIGEISLQYEDENANLNEFLIPFSIDIQEAWSDGMDDPWGPGGMDWEEEETGELKTATVVLCVIGGLLLATPLALYMHKRIKANGIEDLDEDI